MHHHMFGVFKKTLIACGLLSMTYACTNDSWESHYLDDPAITTQQVLWDKLLEQDQLSDFRDILDSVKVMSGRKITNVSYADLLRLQYFTVFAPVNGTFNKDSLLALCATVEGNQLVERQFVMTHLSRRPFSLSAGANPTMAFMFNGKHLPLENSALAGVPFIVSQSNVVARNGIIHNLTSAIPYRMNVYEYIKYFPEFERMGGFLTSFEKDSLDERASVPAGLGQDGMLEYVDSVMIEKNELLRYFGLINAEDSAYRMLAPSKAAWNTAYNTVSSYFNYGSILGADSLKRHWTNYALMRDLFFNWNEQESPEDSLVTTQYVYNKRNPSLHVYHKPFEPGGILHNATPLTASNGVIYQTDTWPFNIEQVFFTPILVEAENKRVYKGHNLTTCTYEYRQKITDSISGNGYMYVSELKPTVQPDVTFYIPNTLSGKYDVFVVMLPVNIFSPQEKNTYPNKLAASLTYVQANGQSKTLDCTDEETNLPYFVNDPYRVDTLKLATVTFPTCNYAQTNVTVSLKIKSAKRTQDVRFLHKMGIDCIYLKPRQD